MEEVENLWKKLSLSEEEEAGFELPKITGIQKALLAGKFLTHRSVNREAVYRTFKPLWRTRKPFCIHDVYENKLVFEFENEMDLERVLESEPWTYDKHLILFQRIDNTTTISSLSFSKCSFWVQIHNLPIKSMTPELGLSIGSSIGKVVRVVDSDEKGSIGRSLRVRVSIDVNKPLSRGRKIWENGVVTGWASFRYERLPNFCYWCGSLMHEDRDCDFWLGMKDKVSFDKKQFGPWMRAEMDLPSRKPWRAGVGSEQAEHFQPRSPKPPTVLNDTMSGVSGEEAGIPLFETVQPEKAIRVGESESVLHAKSLFENSKNFDETLQMIDSELGLTEDFVAPPKAVSLEGAFNEESSLPKKSPAEKDPGAATPVPISQYDASGLQVANGPSLIVTHGAESERPPLVDISNSCGPKSKPQTKNKGTWTRLDRKPTTSSSDANMNDLNELNRKRPACIETEPKTNKRRSSSSHGCTPLEPISAVAVTQPRRSP